MRNKKTIILTLALAILFKRIETYFLIEVVYPLGMGIILNYLLTFKVLESYNKNKVSLFFVLHNLIIFSLFFLSLYQTYFSTTNFIIKLSFILVGFSCDNLFTFRD